MVDSKRHMLALQHSRQRIRRWLEAFPPRIRYPAFYAAVILGGRWVGLAGLKRVAADLEGDGAYREALRCWQLVHKRSPDDSGPLSAMIRCAFGTGDVRGARRVLDGMRMEAQLPPRLLIGIAGQLAVEDRLVEAGRVVMLLSQSGNSVVSQSPSIVSALIATDWPELAARLLEARPGVAAYIRERLTLARLCFTLQSMDTAASLYRSLVRTGALTPVDRVAFMHSLSCGSTAPVQVGADELLELAGEVEGKPHALGLLARVALLSGHADLAKSVISDAVKRRYGSADVTADCMAIMDVLADLRSAREPFSLETLGIDSSIRHQGGVPKTFVCGFGWTGSGAVYDAIRGYHGFREFEGAGLDEVINQDAESEVTFVQSSGGLGDLWVRANADGELAWGKFWELFSLHVAGLGFVGYSQYKSCAAAANHVEKYRQGYTQPFRTFFENYSSLLKHPQSGGLHRLLADTAEQLCGMLLEQTGGNAVLFNNAVFGRNVRMLEIFRCYRAAIVYREPRDVFVDRVRNDKNHWRTPVQAAAFYSDSLNRYVTCRASLSGDSATSIREVSFERFVKERAFRDVVAEWLVPEGDKPETSYFDAQVSLRNIGIHKGVLSKAEMTRFRHADVSLRRMKVDESRAWP